MEAEQTAQISTRLAGFLAKACGHARHANGNLGLRERAREQPTTETASAAKTLSIQAGLALPEMYMALSGCSDVAMRYLSSPWPVTLYSCSAHEWGGRRAPPMCYLVVVVRQLRGLGHDALVHEERRCGRLGGGEQERGKKKEQPHLITALAEEIHAVVLQRCTKWR